MISPETRETSRHESYSLAVLRDEGVLPETGFGYLMGIFAEVRTALTRGRCKESLGFAPNAFLHTAVSS